MMLDIRSRLWRILQADGQVVATAVRFSEGGRVEGHHRDGASWGIVDGKVPLGDVAVRSRPRDPPTLAGAGRGAHPAPALVG